MTDSPAPAGAPRVASMRVFVRALTLEAEIGVHLHEHGRSQPLLIDVELEVAVAGAQDLEETVDYQQVVAHARAVAHTHVKLAEDFAERLARLCMGDPRVLSARVRVEKPEALAPEAAGAGAEITLARA